MTGVCQALYKLYFISAFGIMNFNSSFGTIGEAIARMSAISHEPVPKSDRLLLTIFTLLGAGLVLAAFLFSWLASQPFVPEMIRQVSSYGILPPACMFKHLTALPCPSCGMTRAMILIARGDLLEAFRYNILSVPLFAAALAFVGAAAVRPSLSLAALKSIGTVRGFVIVIALLLAAWLIKLAGPPAYW